MLLASSAQYPLMYRTATHTKNFQPKMSIVLRLRNPALSNVYIHRQKISGLKVKVRPRGSGPNRGLKRHLRIQGKKTHFYMLETWVSWLSDQVEAQVQNSGHEQSCNAVFEDLLLWDCGNCCYTCGKRYAIFSKKCLNPSTEVNPRSPSVLRPHRSEALIILPTTTFCLLPQSEL